MKVLLFLFLFPVSFAAAPGCGELKTILQTYERDLHRYKFPQCNKEFIKSLIPTIPVVEKDETDIESLACQDFTVVDNVLNNYLSELAILDGIAKMRVDVDASKKGTDPQKFIDSLGMAQSMEALTNTKIGETYLLQELKQSVSSLKTTQQLRAKVAELCNEKVPEKKNACTPGVFNPTDAQTKEILALLQSSKTGAEEISSWKSELTIRKKSGEESAYSFIQMREELGEAFTSLKSGKALSSKHMLAIKKLDDFSFDPKYAVLKDAANNSSTVSDRFLTLMEQTRDRQRIDIQSKVSLLFDEIKNEMKDQFPLKEDGNCHGARLASGHEAAIKCMEELNSVKDKITDPSNLLRSKFDILYKNIQKTKIYADNLEKNAVKCREEMASGKELPESCLQSYSVEREKLKAKVDAVSTIKRKMAENNEDKMKFRNFALMKWESQKCGQMIESRMEYCSQDNSLSQDAFLTVGHALDIAIKFTKTPEAEKEAKDVCDKKEENETLKKPEKRLCSFFSDDVSDVIPLTPPKFVKGPTDAPESDRESQELKTHFVNSAAEIAKQLIDFKYPQQNPMGVPPYPYNYFPSYPTTPPMGIADTIMFNARAFGGYGYYMPTPGLSIGTAFGAESSWTSYKSTSVPKSSYFGF